MKKCEACIHRNGPDVERCLQCGAAAPSGTNAALAVVLAVLFIMAVVAAVEAAHFGRSGDGILATLFSGRDATPVAPGKNALPVPPTGASASGRP